MISLQINKKMQEELDKIQEKLGYASRSEALRESINMFIRKHQRDEPTEGHKIAIITVYHNSEREDILDEFTDISQNYEHLIKTINQYNLRSSMIKSIIVSGPGTEIHEYYQNLTSNRHFNCSITYMIIPEKLD